MYLLEQILETGIFSSNGKDLSREFVPFNENLTAEYFAKELNSGRLSVEDAFRYFWSYEEDADLWDLPKDREWRNLLPDWKPILLTIMTQCSEEVQSRIRSVLSENYCLVGTERFNPFGVDRRLIKTKEEIYEELITEIYSRLPNELTEYEIELTKNKSEQERRNDWWKEKLSPSTPKHDAEIDMCITKIGLNGFYDNRFLELLRNHKHNDHLSRTFIYLKRFDPSIIPFALDVDPDVKKEVLCLLDSLSSFIEDPVEMLDSANPFLRSCAAKALSCKKKYHKKLHELLDDGVTRKNALLALIEFGVYDDRLVSFLDDPDLMVIAITGCVKFGIYTDKLLELVSYKGEYSGNTICNQYYAEKVRITAIKALGKLKHYDLKLLTLLDSDNEESKASIEALISIGYKDPHWIDLLKSRDRNTAICASKAIVALNYYDPKITDLLGHRIQLTRELATLTLYGLGKYDERMGCLLTSNDDKIKRMAIAHMGKSKIYSSQLISLLCNKDNEIRSVAYEAFISANNIEPDFFDLFKQNDPDVLQTAMHILVRLKKNHPILKEMLTHSNPDVSIMAARAFRLFGDYDPIIEKYIHYGDKFRLSQVQISLYKMKQFNPKLEYLLKSTNEYIKLAAIYSFVNFPEKIMDFLSYIDLENENERYYFEMVMIRYSKFHPALIDMIGYGPSYHIAETLLNLDYPSLELTVSIKKKYGLNSREELNKLYLGLNKKMHKGKHYEFTRTNT